MKKMNKWKKNNVVTKQLGNAGIGFIGCKKKFKDMIIWNKMLRWKDNYIKGYTYSSWNNLTRESIINSG